MEHRRIIKNFTPGNRVAVFLPIPSTCKFDYLVPAGLSLRVGDLVKVSFRGRRLIGVMAKDLIDETARRIADINPKSAASVRHHAEPVARFSQAMHDNDTAIKRFLFTNMYRHYKLNRMTSKGRRVVKDLFQLLIGEPECLPTDWRQQAGQPNSEPTARLVAEYIAGMTDRYALDEHKRLFDLQARIS